MLNALAGSIPARERIISCEEVFELNLPSRDWVPMQCRQPSLEGTGEVTLRSLVKEALRMRPTRIIVGEVREAESLDLLVALNSGLPGAGTIHANSARAAITKICTLPLLAGANNRLGMCKGLREVGTPCRTRWFFTERNGGPSLRLRKATHSKRSDLANCERSALHHYIQSQRRAAVRIARGQPGYADRSTWSPCSDGFN